MIAEIAARQHGVVRLDQLRWGGLTATQIKLRVRAARLHRLYRGVYAVGHESLSREGRWIAAVFACGEAAALSHESAACLWSLTPACPPFSHVTIPAHARRAKRRGVVLHRSRSLTPREITLRRNIAVTTPARTRRDLGWDAEPTRSDLDRSFLRLLRSYELPVPEANAKLGRYEVDFLWRAVSLAVELDGYALHSSRASFESDRRRDRELARRGYVVLRFTYREVTGEPGAVAASLRSHLRRRFAAM